MKRGSRGTQAVTMAMVAERAGVSAMTVSNVLNGSPKVQEANRAAVMKAVRELNYTPSMAAKALAAGQEIRIGLLHPSVENAYLGAVLLGALEASTRLGAQLLLRRWDLSTWEAAEAEVRNLVRAGANALLLPAPLCEKISGSGLVEALSIPTIALSPGAPLSDMPSIKIDEHQAMRQMTSRLTSLGHQRIGFIQGSALHRSAAARRDGFFAAMAEAGLETDPALHIEADYLFDAGVDAASRLLDLPQPPTAIVCSNDEIAAGAIAVAYRRHLHIPEDLSVTGFDDSPIASRLSPALTTVRQPIAKMAELAVEFLVRQVRVSGGDASLPGAETRHIDHEIIERGSVGPPRSGRLMTNGRPPP